MVFHVFEILQYIDKVSENTFGTLIYRMTHKHFFCSSERSIATVWDWTRSVYAHYSHLTEGSNGCNKIMELRFFSKQYSSIYDVCNKTPCMVCHPFSDLKLPVLWDVDVACHLLQYIFSNDTKVILKLNIPFRSINLGKSPVRFIYGSSRSLWQVDTITNIIHINHFHSTEMGGNGN